MSAKAPSKVVVVGAGQMGSGIAQVFAAKGVAVALVDVRDDLVARGREGIRSSLARIVKKGALAADEAERTLGRVAGSTRVDAARDADLCIEAIVEDEAAKKDLFAKLDAIAPPDAVLASNTSSISITVLAAATRRAQRVIGMHFMNPVPVMQLVEVIRGQETSDDTTARVLAAVEILGKTPVEAHDYPGFVSNRVLMPMINEAIFALMEGVATRDGIDTVLKLGMNHPMGPLALADLIGLDTCLSILEVLHRGFGDPKYRPCPLLRRMVASGHLGRKTGRGFYDYAPAPAAPAPAAR
ncbi:MAG TPA: 3-hydroxybutyryl-CoA dehydrogenase [Planctomycetota bacterium]|nr:3-hydroxybutyryl-CoA dehydrogenase [Planctomycetota bacterium]